ncbi:MAG: short-chain dehydrogenase [Proteobacteria bacterium]|nr:MAG: short-chain dehydrogenase [Pseudomonadota bacterium]
MNVLITGANRGLGLGFVQHYLAKGDQVWACYRSECQALADMNTEALHLLQWDVSQDKAPSEGLPDAIDLLINNAGIYGSTKGGQSLDVIAPDDMLEVFNVNTVGPLRVVQHLKDRVIAAQGVIANVSSKMGSSADNSSGGTYAYRASKAALVIVSKSMAVDLQSDGVRVITLHPGWVQTDMTHHSGLIDIETSVKGMTQVIADVDHYEAGQFVAFDGKIVPY